jgi:hypothetical protein
MTVNLYTATLQLLTFYFCPNNRLAQCDVMDILSQAPTLVNGFSQIRNQH